MTDEHLMKVPWHGGSSSRCLVRHRATRAVITVRMMTNWGLRSEGSYLGAQCQCDASRSSGRGVLDAEHLHGFYAILVDRNAGCVSP